MNALQIPWLELAIGIAIIGSVSVAQIREPNRAYHWGLAFTGLSFACTLLAALAYDQGTSAESIAPYSLQTQLFGRQLFRLDELSAPLVPTVALLHFLTALATARTHMRRFSFSWSLAAEAIRLATFSCLEPWALVGLLAIATVPPYVELVNRGRPVGVYVLHMSLFVVLLLTGWAAVDTAGSISSAQAQAGTILLALAAYEGLARSRTFRHYTHALLGDRLVRACLVRDRDPVCGAAERRIRCSAAGAADRAGVGPAEYRSDVAGHGRLRGGHGHRTA